MEHLLSLLNNGVHFDHDRSVVEEEEERGVAHIVEHLAFSATKKYTNHDIVKFLEGAGAEFGACQNASTSADDTIYEFLVPIAKPELLSQAISVLAEFSSEKIWKRKEVLSWKNIEEVAMLMVGCKMHTGI
ncbi:hypothetical protein MKW94_023898 [Papaver nudicaule]|uniref:Peptidase M16 N-terminal domain-containing protein n=1 Tax=Papaver nudicaule TaxID=74823 RepID=A0AA41S2I3_PAPNU|nr:hypothetical protein [Papaver nudicaule]